MDVSELRTSSSVTVAASPEELYAFIADMPRMGEVSPECTGGTWASGDRGVGALFIGSNQRPERSWQRRVRMAVVDPPHTVAWENFGDPGQALSADEQPAARWTYSFVAVDGGTEVTESWELFDHPLLEGFSEERLAGLKVRHASNIEQTLANLKQLFER
jgi:hypothetical protein